MNTFACCMAGIMAFGLTARTDDRWLRLTSPNFEVLTDAGASTGRETLRRFEQIRQVFETRTQTQKLSPLPVRIYVFKSDSGFRPYKIQPDAAGYYQAGRERDYIAMRADGHDSYRVVFHEYVHLVLKHAGLPAPIWFNEGMAELYSTVNFAKTKIKIGDLIQAHILTLRSEKMLDIPTLMNVDLQSPYYNERGKTGIFYAQSWALLHMLNFSAGYQPGLANFIELILTGESHNVAFQRAFGKSETDVLKDLTQYVRRDRFTGLVVNAAPIENPRDMTAESLTSLDAEVCLADLAFAVQKDSEAERIYQKLKREFPESADVEAGLGDLAMRKGNDEEAHEHYRRAIGMDIRSGRVHFDYAMLLRDIPGREAEFLEHLRKAVALDDKLFDAHHLLGYLSLRDKRYGEAIRHLSRAVDLQPGRVTVWEYLALSYHYSGDDTHARDAVMKARKLAVTPEDVARVEATMKLIETKRTEVVLRLPISPRQPSISV